MGPLLGEHDEHLKTLEDAFPESDILVRGNEILVDGSDVDLVADVFTELLALVRSGHILDRGLLKRTIDMVRADERPSEVLGTDLLQAGRGRRVRPKTAGQKRYTDAIEANIITFGLGPAGTGKSWLAVAMAVAALQNKAVDRLILT